MKNKQLIIFRIVLGALFVTHQASTLFFSHTHNFDNQKITHSHPYLPSDQHSHTTASFQLIQHLSFWLFTLAASSLLFFGSNIVFKLPLFNVRCLFSSSLFTIKLRGPPIY